MHNLISGATHTSEMLLGCGQSPYVLVTHGSHPGVLTALNMLAHDAGYGAGHAVFLVSHIWASWLDNLSKILQSLPAEDLETFCIGEDSEQAAVAERSEAHTQAHQFLTLCFLE